MTASQGDYAAFTKEVNAAINAKLRSWHYVGIHSYPYLYAIGAGGRILVGDATTVDQLNSYFRRNRPRLATPSEEECRIVKASDNEEDGM